MKQIPLNEALQLADKTTANIVATIVKAEVKAPPGKNTYWNARVEECGVACYLSSFGVSLASFIGKRVVFVGAEVGSYNGKKQLTLGKRGLVQEWMADFEAAQAPQTAPQRTFPGAGPSSPPVRQNAPTASGTPKNSIPVHGATIGMCVKGALDIWLQERAHGGQPWGADSINFVYGTANQLLGICQRLEKHSADADSSDVPF